MAKRASCGEERVGAGCPMADAVQAIPDDARTIAAENSIPHPDIEPTSVRGENCLTTKLPHKIERIHSAKLQAFVSDSQRSQE
jgi:hypothetical protein